MATNSGNRPRPAGACPGGIRRAHQEGRGHPGAEGVHRTAAGPASSACSVRSRSTRQYDYKAERERG